MRHRRQCEYSPFCEEEAQFLAWFGTGVVCRLRVCGTHVKSSRAYGE
jgi:hypothetical protein